MDTLAHLTALVSLHITPAEWSFSLQQLQPLSACTRLTELALPQLALGFANDPRRIDRNGTQVRAYQAQLPPRPLHISTQHRFTVPTPGTVHSPAQGA